MRPSLQTRQGTSNMLTGGKEITGGSLVCPLLQHWTADVDSLAMLWHCQVQQLGEQTLPLVGLL